MERQMVQREQELRDWQYEEIPLAKLREMVDELIAQHGEGALWCSGVEWESLALKVKYETPETDQELAHRVEQHERTWKRQQLAQAAWDKLTPEERDALRMVRPPSQ